MRLRAPEPATLHLQKLAVGVPSIEAFEARVQARRDAGDGMQVWTRSFPKRAADILQDGSLFWVVGGVMAVRQRVLSIELDAYDDGSRCTRIEVEPCLVRVAPRPLRPFQGWRYLEAVSAPPDLQGGEAAGLHGLPIGVLRQLRELCLV